MPLNFRKPFLATARALMDLEKVELILKVIEKQQNFTMNASLKQPYDIEEFKRIDHWRSNKNKKEKGGIIDQDNSENLVIWKTKDNIKNHCQCNRCKAENSLFKPI